VTRLLSVRPQYVEYIPDHLEQGVLYVSKRFRTASHLCCCGCSMKVVTPLNPAKWSLIEQGSAVSLSPSIGNWGFPCRSHYLIIRNQVRWAEQLSQRQISVVRHRDQKDVALLATSKGPLVRFAEALRRWLA
jgi:hypothetical protein